MLSSFSWLDYSDSDRRKMLDVIDQFGEQDTRDELGIGTIRDALSDILFPGTTTIQTRARYFLFVPWIYLNLERRKIASAAIARLARRDEMLLVDALAASPDAEGTIGIQARGGLKRLASSVYWQGMAVWGIREFPGSQDQYHRALDRFYMLGQHIQRTDDGEPVAGRLARNWHAGLPDLPDRFPKEASFAVPRHEARYLRDRIAQRCPGSLLAFLIDAQTDLTIVDFPWEHTQLADFLPENREQLDHARNLSETVHGALLLYNLMLAEVSQRNGLASEYEHRLRVWADAMVRRIDALSAWDRSGFWRIATSTGARVTPRTRGFVEEWLEIAITDPGGVAGNRRARSLIHDRERALKRQLARLDNRRALEMWSGAAGTGQLNYRWPTVRTIIADIVKGLWEGAPDA